MPKFVGRVSRYPARSLFVWYLLLIVCGGVLLAQPICGGDASRPISAIDAVFTATSASCVTGLAVRSTGNDFSFIGQFVILALIQLGGIGIITVTTYVTLSWRGRESVRHRATMAETLGAGSTENIRGLLREILALTLLFEGAGFLLLFVRFWFDMEWGKALWFAAFHSVSAFCNAGFGLWDDSLTRYQHDVTVNLTIMALIVLGGIGYPVLRDLYRNWKRPGGIRWRRLQLNTKLVLTGTALLIVVGAAAFVLLEWNNVFANKPVGTSLLVGLFHSVSARTAGFNTVDVAQLTNATLFILVLLMYVGASPGSAGGGFKVSTFMVLALHAWSKLRGRRSIRAFRRNIPGDVVSHATATVLLFAFIGTVGLCLLLVIEEADIPHHRSAGEFMDALFEVVSAQATVGLSTGFTNVLSTAGKCLIILLMFIGRLGPITLVAILTLEQRRELLKYPDEPVLIG